MKCTVCGSEFSPNADSCPNCGTRVIEMSGMHGKHTEFGSNPDAIDLTYDGKKHMQKSHTVRNVILTLVIILALLVGAAGFVYYQNFGLKTYEIDDFSIKLPVSMELDDDSLSIEKFDFGDAFQTKGKSYKNYTSVFSYISIDFSSSLSESDTQAITDSVFLAMLDQSISQNKTNDYKKYSLDDNVLICSVKNKDGELMYDRMVCEKRGSKYYVFIFECRDKHKELFEDKFEQWAETIDID